MFEIKDSICIAGGMPPCEDAIGFGDNYIFALDGASCLTGVNLVHNESDAHWFASNVRDGLCRLLDSGDSRSTEELLRQVIAPLKEEYINGAEKSGTPIPDDSPSAGIALFRIREGFLEFYGLGDCVGVVATKDGKTQWLNDPSLSKLDGIVISKMAQLHKETGISVTQAKSMCTDLLIKHRGLKNKPEGYHILDPFGEGIDHACKLRIPLNDVESVSVFSDGFAQLSEVFGVFDDFSQLHAALAVTPLSELCDKLFALQGKDPDCNEYPRFKLRDDTCAVFATLQ